MGKFNNIKTTDEPPRYISEVLRVGKIAKGGPTCPDEASSGIRCPNALIGQDGGLDTSPARPQRCDIITQQSHKGAGMGDHSVAGQVGPLALHNACQTSPHTVLIGKAASSTCTCPKGGRCHPDTGADSQTIRVVCPPYLMLCFCISQSMVTSVPASLVTTATGTWPAFAPLSSHLRLSGSLN